MRKERSAHLIYKISNTIESWVQDGALKVSNTDTYEWLENKNKNIVENNRRIHILITMI